MNPLAPSSAYPELSALVGPTVPDLRGLFLRGYGSQVYAQNNGSTVGVTATLHESGQLGQVQGDAIRRVFGNGKNYIEAWNNPGSSEGAIYTADFETGDGAAWNSNINGCHRDYIDSSRVVPTAAENRPVNTAVRYLLRARP